VNIGSTQGTNRSESSHQRLPCKYRRTESDVGLIGSA
jgi:hypothetical protein